MTAKKTIFSIFIIFALLLTACGSSSSPSGADEPWVNFVPSRPDSVRDYPLEPVSGKTVFEYFKDEKILVGWNLGNTLDAHSNGIAGETNWGNPAINQDLLNGVKAAGFDIVRIPITWMGYIGMGPEHRIASSRLQRAADVVDMAHKAGLKVIINLHHDGSSPMIGKDDGWLSVARASKNSRDYERITHQFARVWDQIAAYFQNYGDWLIFESMNEIHDGGWGHSTDFKMFPHLQTDIVNKWNQVFTDRVRASGGNNAERFLLIPAYCTIPEQTLASSFVLPKDSTPDKLIVTFHYYYPHEFSIEARRATWGTDAEKQRVDRDFAPFKSKYVDNNIPVIIGEAGAALQSGDAARQAQARQSRYEYISHVFATAAKYGLIPVYWDNGSTSGSGEKFGIFDRRSGRPNSEESASLITMMVNAVR